MLIRGRGWRFKLAFVLALLWGYPSRAAKRAVRRLERRKGTHQ